MVFTCQCQGASLARNTGTKKKKHSQLSINDDGETTQPSGRRARWFSRGGGIGTRDRNKNHRNDERRGSGGGLVVVRRRRTGPDVVALQIV